MSWRAAQFAGTNGRGYSSCVLRTASLLFPALATALALQLPLPRPPAPDLILINGRVITVDRNFSIAEGVAIIGDRILTTGNEDQLRALSGPSTRVIDLKGNTVIPGLMDNHLHGSGGGPGVDLSRARSLGDVYAALASRVTQAQPGEIIVSNSDWHEAQLDEQRLPLRDDLDRVAPRHPVVLVRGGHEYILNSAALARWNITPDTPQPEGGRITRYSDGRLNGELVDAAKALVQLPPAAARSPDQRRDDRVAEYKKLNEAGLTTVRHPGVSIAD
jgi:predicted amidohydrolase YtcJ